MMLLRLTMEEDHLTDRIFDLGKVKRRAVMMLELIEIGTTKLDRREKDGFEKLVEVTNKLIVSAVP